MKLQSAWVILFSLVVTTTNAQIKLIYTSSGDAIEKGIKASDDEKYTSVIRQFSKVYEGDTNYHLARYEMVNNLILDEQYDKAIAVSVEELKTRLETSNLLFTALGNAYDKNEQSELAVTAYADGNGMLQYIREYYHVKVVGYSYPGIDGKPVETISIVNESVETKAYFANGKVSREFTMTNGEFEGKYDEYNTNGQLATTTLYKKQRKTRSVC